MSILGNSHKNALIKLTPALEKDLAIENVLIQEVLIFCGPTTNDAVQFFAVRGNRIAAIMHILITKLQVFSILPSSLEIMDQMSGGATYLANFLDIIC